MAASGPPPDPVMMAVLEEQAALTRYVVAPYEYTT
jgi:hypothetical protein